MNRLTPCLDVRRVAHMNTSPEAPDLIPIGEAAKLLNVSVDTLRRWEARGYITATRTPSGQRRFAATEIDRVRAAR